MLKTYYCVFLFCSGVKNKRSNGNSFFANLYLVNQFLCNPVHIQPNIQPNTQPIDKTTSRYQSNIIVQSSNDPIAVNAANALFNKHPNTSILAIRSMLVLVLLVL
jgi:hypothetical protein